MLGTLLLPFRHLSLEHAWIYPHFRAGRSAPLHLQSRASYHASKPAAVLPSHSGSRHFQDLETARVNDKPVRSRPTVAAASNIKGTDHELAQRPTRAQAKDVEMEEEASRASAPSPLEENLSRDSGYDSLNGIGLKRH